MSFLTALETLLLGPLKLLFEIIFVLSGKLVQHPGLSIICLSLAMNILVLPLYKRADAMQEESRDMENKLHRGVSHIKKVFSGDERMMILQTYYRQNHYKPTNALSGSVSLLLEIPFFMAAYQFLSSLEALSGVSFGPIADLSKPDGLLVIGGLTLNLLPILMTLINVISSALYLKGFPLKTKIQLYGMAAFFLVFLYTSPAGLVFYWTLNNLFSLVKTIFYKIKNPAGVLRVMLAVFGVGVLALPFLLEIRSLKGTVALLAFGLLLLFPLAKHLLSGKLDQKKEAKKAEPNKKMFLAGSLYLTVLVGLLIPATFIAASPQEYVDITYFHNPLWYILSSALMAAGLFLVWLRVFYWLAKPEGKVLFDRAVVYLSVAMTANYMFFGTDLGIISASLQYENIMAFTRWEQVINLLVLALLLPLLFFLAKKLPKAVTAVCLVACLSLGVMSGVHLVTIKKSVDEVSNAQLSDSLNIELSTEGKNVVVIMLDRALGQYVPYMMNEKPELKEQFQGFTWYANTISHGLCTNFCSPALMGGYEYTPVEMNRRENETLAEKHDEAVKLMPVIFDRNGWDVSVCDSPYAGYQWVSDLSTFNEYPDIKTFNAEGRFSDPNQKAAVITANHRNFFCFSLMKTMPLSLQPVLYNGGNYNRAATNNNKLLLYGTQVVEEGGFSRANGVDSAFINGYNVLLNLPNVTRTTDDEKNSFLFLCSNLPHYPTILQEPDYTPAEKVDNTEFDAANTHRFTVDGKTLEIYNSIQMSHYHVNMATFLQLGNWFDSLRERGVWDNTRIILVSDHGNNLSHDRELVHNVEGVGDLKDVESFYPLLMVKDFNSKEFSVSQEFMTNADTPTLAFENLIENPVNPFTGKTVNSDEKTAHEQFVILSTEWDIAKNNGNCFLPGQWASVKDNLRVKENWTWCRDFAVLKEHAFPQNSIVVKGE